MKKAAFLLSFAVAILSSCSSSYVAKEELAQMDAVALFEPVVAIDDLFSDGYAYNDSLSVICREYIFDGMETSMLPAGDSYTAAGEAYSYAMASLSTMDRKSIEGFKVPLVLHNMIVDNGYRYGAFLYANGYKTEKKLYRRQMWIGFGVGLAVTLLTLGTVYVLDLPSEGELNMWAIVVDAETDKVIYFNEAHSYDCDPLAGNRARNLARNIFSEL